MKKKSKRKYNRKKPKVFVAFPVGPALNDQVGGDHYKNMNPQPMEFILGNDLHYTEGRVVEYMARWRVKGGVLDLQKARHMLDILIEHEAGKKS